MFRKATCPRSIPAVFAPVEINGQLLVDGGMVDNIGGRGPRIGVELVM